MPNIFITGVSSGVGRQLTKQYIADGHKVWGVARRKPELQELSEELGENNFLYSVCDVSNEIEVKNTKSEMDNHDFKPDIVI